MKDFIEWRGAVRKEYLRLRDVEPYLNATGLLRVNSLRVILGYADFCETATELVEWFKTGTGISDDHITAITNANVNHILNALHRTAKKEAGK